jgi:hypothetical protein
MSQENVELSRDAMNAFNQRDSEAFLTFFDDDVKFVSRLGAIEGDYSGQEGIRRLWSTLFGVWPDLTAELLEVHAVRDQATVAAVRFRGQSAGSEVPWEWTVWQAARWRRGKLVTVHSMDTRAEALDALRLSEHAAHADS